MSAFELKTETVIVEGRTCVISQMRARDALIMQGATPEMTGFHLIACAVEIDGMRYAPEEVADWPQAVVNVLLPIALRLNGMRAEVGDAEAPVSGNEPRPRKTA
ncbi:MAG TPA: hypothetical protein VNQ78_18755 [Paracoccus sp. (in: a-proteobacteria)]|uniref:hypothetical protein n=1 Tax=Paracoccus sp. TaxID=267 RepID=UPI002C6D2E68|nr:hypothetical protein [Paracoccus sp. (in: a-proteobacteria)]HWL58698.1 hypothetical protein [Paracoccus sp. (in: a-proteobacteria)]